MNRLERSAAYLGDRMQLAAGRPVVYVVVPGAEEYHLSGVVNATQYEIVDETGALTVVTAYDWLFAVSHFPDGFVPARGHVIHDGKKTYAVLPLRPQPEWRYEDPQGVLFRIHSKLVELSDV